MQEENNKPFIRPGIADALDPDIGNGALWETDPHLSLLRSPDPQKKMDSLLLDESTSQLIVNTWNNPEEDVTIENSDLPQTMNTSLSIEPENEIAPFAIEKKIFPILEKIKEDHRIRSAEENQEIKAEPESGPFPVHSIKEKLKESKPKKIGKVGKRVRKVIETAKKVQETGSTQVQQEKSIGPMDVHLSPFTQWLKNLRGSEYVHPYEDDYGLDNKSATSGGGVSETLADLLASQGYIDQAREMYLQLQEKYPEKSSFFAAKIEALKS